MKNAPEILDFTLKKNVESAKAIGALAGTGALPPGVDKVAVMPNARKSDSNLPAGAVYFCKGGARAGPIVGGDPDLCAGVSLHLIRKFPAGAPACREDFVIRAFSGWARRAGAVPFHDYSVRRSETEEKVSLGPHESAVMIMKTDAADPKWFICVKTYSSTRARAALEFAGEATVSQLYESPQYKSAVRAGATTRAALAASVAESLGVDVGAVTGKTSPEDADVVTLAPVWAECLYNVIEKSPDAPDSYAYFKHCYSLHTCTGGVPVFHRAAAGATFFNMSDTPHAQFPAFPTSFPFDQAGGGGGGRGAAPLPAGVFWGGKMCHNRFLQQGLAVSHELGAGQREWSARLEQLGFDYKDGTTRLTSVASYISTSAEHTVPLGAILDAAPTDAHIFIPVKHDCIIELLCRHAQIREADPSINLSDFLRREDDAGDYFVVHTADLRKLRDATDALSKPKTKNEKEQPALPAAATTQQQERHQRARGSGQ